MERGKLMEIKVTINGDGSVKLDFSEGMHTMQAIAILEIAKNLILNGQPNQPEINQIIDVNE